MPDTFRPIKFRWTGKAFENTSAFWFGIATKNLIVDQDYFLVEYHERSGKSHRQYFAAVREAWANLPDEMWGRWPTAEHLRKFALIKMGYRHERSLICASESEALRIASFMEPVSEHAQFVISSLSENILIEWRAESQSYRSMGKERFQQSKQDVLEFCAELIGVTVEQLLDNAEKAA